MQKININNEELKSFLQKVLDKYICCEKNWNFDPFEQTKYYVGTEYLNEIQLNGHAGLPERSVLKLLQDDVEGISKREHIEYKHIRLSLSSGLRKIFPVWHLTLMSLYPPGGYIGWHSNYDVPGYNVILTWSETGDGFFRYVDPKTREIITMQDTPGWSCKMGYFGSGNEELWHCAYTNCRRATIAFRFENKDAQDLAKGTISAIMSSEHYYGNDG